MQKDTGNRRGRVYSERLLAEVEEIFNLETLFFDYNRQYNVKIKVARIFNTKRGLKNDNIFMKIADFKKVAVLPGKRPCLCDKPGPGQFQFPVRPILSEGKKPFSRSFFPFFSNFHK